MFPDTSYWSSDTTASVKSLCRAASGWPVGKELLTLHADRWKWREEPIPVTFVDRCCHCAVCHLMHELNLCQPKCPFLAIESYWDKTVKCCDLSKAIMTLFCSRRLILWYSNRFQIELYLPAMNRMRQGAGPLGEGTQKTIICEETG